MRTTSRPRRLVRTGLGAAALLALALTSGAAPAYAVTGSVSHVEADGATVRAVLSLAELPSGATPDLGSVEVTFAGEPVEATASPASQSAELRRTTVLAVDVSNSMRGERFEQAKLAAKAFLDTVPANVHVGLVTFADEVTVAQAPTLDLDRVRSAVDGLRLSQWTRVHEGVLEAVDLAGDDGARSVLLLSDGEDTSRTPVDTVTAAVAEAGVRVDVVALGEAVRANDALERIALAGEGRVLTTDDPAALSAVFAEEAAALDQQVLVTFERAAELAGAEGTLQVTLDVAGAGTVTDGAFVALPEPETTPSGDALGGRLPPAETGFVMPAEWMYAALAATVLALVGLAWSGFAGGRTEEDDLDSRIEAYTRRGARRLAGATREQPHQGGVAQQAVAVAENVLDGRKGLETALGDRLEGAGMALKPAEWLLVHAGTTFGLGLLLLLLGGGDVVLMLVGLLLGAALPWLYLSLKRRRRLAAFKSQLADTLQLMSGSLSAGLSLAQAVDTVVREGADPIASEFRRALVETRLGVGIEDALSGVAQRMQSVDFEWVVMAIAIQRDVGGNLAELLTKVAETIREREYLQRQVRALSAEGRLSVYVLAGLPPGFMLFLLVTNPGYLQPMWTHPLGLLMLGTMTVMILVGTFWMKKLVKVEV